MPSDTTSSDAPRVLVVDDNARVLSRAAEVLSHGCEVVGTASDGPAALAAADRLHPDVVVLDISMPGMTGLEVASRLRLLAPTPAVVFLTVHEEAEVVAAALAVGALAYVVKARLASDLVPAVKAAILGRRFDTPRH